MGELEKRARCMSTKRRKNPAAGMDLSNIPVPSGFARAVAIVVASSLSTRGKLGWPCFHCGAPFAKCKKKRCCKRCKRKASH